ncbi:MAG: radical SAM protein [bacterium]|nr:radical SAM protein [bacterium]
MKLANFTFIVTDDCNYDCSYCPQKKENLYMDIPVIEKSLDFFFPYFNEDIYTSFYGGEPLLAFEQVKHAVLYAEQKNKNNGKKIHFSMTTNGSLLNEKINGFLDGHKFSVMLSFDGLAHDKGRQRDNFNEMVTIIKEMPHYQNIQLATNSVFTPETVDDLSQSMQFIIGLGIKEPRMALSTVREWDDNALTKLKEQLTDLKNFLVSHYKKTGAIPVSDFKKNEEKGMFACFAGQDRMSVTPEGNLWGCFLFPDFFKDKKDTQEYQKFFLGGLDDFISGHETIMAKKLPNYKKLYQRSFYTDKNFCFECEEVEECNVCPVNAALSGSILLGKIPLWRCRINKIKKEIREEFLKITTHE